MKYILIVAELRDIDIKEYIYIVEKKGRWIICQLHWWRWIYDYDLNLLKLISKITKTPIIACGGAGNVNHKASIFKLQLKCGACGEVVNFGDNNPFDKEFFNEL